MNEMTRAGEWDFESGWLPIDFANTTYWRGAAEPQEHLTSYEALLSWSQDAGLLGEEEARALLAEAERRPKEAAAALQDAIHLREVIYRMLSALAHEREPEPEDVERLNRAIAEALAKTRIEASDGGFAWGWEAGEGAFDRMLWPIARAMGDLLTSKAVERVGECADEGGCCWLFYDTSRNHSRRWCSMESCGNRAKARRHYERSKEGQAG